MALNLLDWGSVNNCLPQSDLQELGNSIITDFERRVASIPDYLCAPFHDEARQLETELLGIYRVVVLCARKEEDLEAVSKLWGLIVQICDQCLDQLRALAQKHPNCGADTYYDRVLDLRNKCNRLQQMHS